MKLTPVTLPPGTVKPWDKTKFDWIAPVRKNDWDCCGRSFGWGCGRGASDGNDHGHLAANHFQPFEIMLMVQSVTAKSAKR
jgi:hypothetical protein